jgi:putative membrane protein
VAHHHFYRDEARQRATAAIRKIEAETAVQVVVALRPRVDDYRAADYLAGFALALAVLAALLYLPVPFSLTSVPLDTLAGFVVGAALCAQFAPLRRLLTSKGRLREATHRAACAAFLDHSLSRTKSRLTVLVFVGMFERCVEVLPDVGIDAAALGVEWNQALAALRASVSGTPDVDDFIAALQRLGPLLQRSYPRGKAQVEELPDDLTDETEDAGRST